MAFAAALASHGGPCSRLCGKGLPADGMGTIPPEPNPAGGGSGLNSGLFSRVRHYLQNCPTAVESEKRDLCRGCSFPSTNCFVPAPRG